MSSPIHHSARSGSISSTLRFCAVCCAAALVAWAIVSVPGTREAAQPTVSASFGPPPTAPVRVMENTAVPHIAPVPVAPSPPQAEIKQADASSEPVLPAGVRAFITAVLDSDTLVKRSKDFLANGDFVSGRLLLRRAAELGSASAALLLGQTFDPLAQRQSPVRGAVTDVAQARQWYRRAANLGSDAASRQLGNLAKMGP